MLGELELELTGSPAARHSPSGTPPLPLSERIKAFPDFLHAMPALLTPRGRAVSGF